MLATRQRSVLVSKVENNPPWSKWYQPGSEDDAAIYASALQKCKDVNEQLVAQPWWDSDSQPGLVATKVIESTPIRLKKSRLYDAAWVESLINKQSEDIKTKRASKPELLQKVDSSAHVLIKVATQIKPIVDIFIPQSPEYSVPYACLWVIFKKGISDRKDKIDSVQGLITSLSQDIPILEIYKDMFPTNDMKQALTEFYIHTLDLLWRLSMYYSHNFFKQLADAMLPRTKYNFSTYLENVKTVAARLKTLCEAGHMAEQKHITESVEHLNSEIRLLKRQLRATSLAQSRYYASEILDAWDYDVDDVEDEFRKWQSLHFFTEIRDHWSHNGILPHLAEWRGLCDSSQNSIFWVSTESNGHQVWVTEFSVNLIDICRSQGQLITFAMCDRPEGAKWTPLQVLKHLISQLLHARPSLTVSAPDIVNIRQFRKADTFNALVKLLHSIVALLGSFVVVIDRLDKCAPDPGAQFADIAKTLSVLVSVHQNLRIVVTTGEVVPPSILPGLPISFAVVSTKRRPRRVEMQRLRPKVARAERGVETYRIYENDSTYEELYG
ncbi:hypothetical protein FP744_10005583 [Trichoderma asperellum]